ncbi:MAG: type II toxin-antitoxin system RelE family toxin [Candidatus Limnocylindria bacterium]
MTYRVEWSERAVSQLDKLELQIARAIVRFMADRVHGQANPRLLGRPLRGERLWRYRVGDYRILCRIDDPVLIVLVVEVGHRREVYR